MKKLMLLFPILFLSCGTPDVKRDIPPQIDKIEIIQIDTLGINKFGIPGFYVEIIKYEGHEYIITREKQYGGVSTIHSESCPCAGRKGKLH
jgi:hypothetical protein